MAGKRYGPQSHQDLFELVKAQPLVWIVSGLGDSFRASLMPVRPMVTEQGQVSQLAGTYSSDQDQHDYYLRANAPTRSGARSGDTTIDELGTRESRQRRPG
ncbi:hypothetical protein J2T60_000747 [Natronospira proteinivora]|uniref:Uncharacterized protein n=1 Tax=Natronospira proteinivora TaxID=1807133 RepID=A0ABT1G654_9GAMM|nr:hypothetical protein [Natronospira proteinivora]MCP1726782.1 hypothetical protein [Natronospira proteinivora]